MKRHLSIATLILLITSAALAPMATLAETNRLNSVVALVNNAVITEEMVYKDIEADLSMLRARFARQPARFQEEASKLRAARLEALIERELVLWDYQNAGFNVPETLIEDQFQEEIVSKFGDRVAFVKTLQKQGKTIEEARKDHREALVVAIMSQQKIKNQITISPFKIERYYQGNQDKFAVEDQVKLRLIQLPRTTGNSTATTEKARDICRQLKEGASFEEMVRKHSTGLYVKDDGLVGTITRNVFLKEIDQAAFSLEAGAVSDPVVTDENVFILKVEEKQPAHVKPLQDVREEIEQVLRAEESARRRKQWIDSIRQKAFIRLF